MGQQVKNLIFLIINFKVIWIRFKQTNKKTQQTFKNRKTGKF